LNQEAEMVRSKKIEVGKSTYHAKSKL